MKKISLYLMLFFFLTTTGCYYSAPPEQEYVQEQFDQNAYEIQTVVSFLEKLENPSVFITEADGTMLVEFEEKIEEKIIDDPQVVLAANTLLKSKVYHHICKIDNTIYLLQWTGLQDISCGIAYTINKVDLPQVIYTTQLLPLSNEGWYYYVADYELWRNQNS